MDQEYRHSWPEFWAQGFTRPHPRCELGCGLIWGSGCWQDSVPCGGRTEVPFSCWLSAGGHSKILETARNFLLHGPPQAPPHTFNHSDFSEGSIPFKLSPDKVRPTTTVSILTQCQQISSQIVEVIPHHTHGSAHTPTEAITRWLHSRVAEYWGPSWNSA